MKICFFPGALHTGGVARNSINLAREFLEEGYEVDFFLTYKEGELLECIPQGVKVFSSNRSAKGSLLSFVSYLRKRKPNVVISARDYLNVLSYLGIKVSGNNCTHIATIRTSTFTERGAQAPLATRFENWLATRVYKRTDHVVAVSDSVRDEETLNRKLKPGVVKKIYNPVVPISLLNKFSDNKTSVKIQVPRICAVGRLTKQKDFSTLLKATKKLVEGGFSFTLSIVGDGELMGDLIQERDDLGLKNVIEFKGALPSAWDEIASADLLVQTSLWEGLPTVLIEALALGTNIVSTDCPGGAAEILGNGKYGFLAEPGSPASIANAIMLAFNSPKPEGFLKSRALDFTSKKAMREYEKLFLKKGDNSFES